MFFGAPWNHTLSDLRGIENPGSDCSVDGTDQHAVGSAGDEVADVVRPNERRHGLAVNFVRIDAGHDRDFPFCDVFTISASPRLAAAGDGRVQREQA